MSWDAEKASKNAIAYYGTDILNVMGATSGNWSSFVILDGQTTIASFTDSGGKPAVKIPIDTALPAGTYVGANGTFTTINLGVAGMISLTRVK